MRTKRRRFLQYGAALAGLKAPSAFAAAESDTAAPVFQTANARWQAAYDRALAILAANVQILPRYAKPS
jgi:hypothetical protein